MCENKSDWLIGVDGLTYVIYVKFGYICFTKINKVKIFLKIYLIKKIIPYIIIYFLNFIIPSYLRKYD